MIREEKVAHRAFFRHFDFKSCRALQPPVTPQGLSTPPAHMASLLCLKAELVLQVNAGVKVVPVVPHPTLSHVSVSIRLCTTACPE